MAIINSNYPDLESSSNLNDIDKFEAFDINSFLDNKRLAVEKVIVDSHIKLEARIVEDKTQYKDEDNTNSNVGKIITFVIHETTASKINIVNIIGREIEVKDYLMTMLMYTVLILYALWLRTLKLKRIKLKASNKELN